MKLSRAMTRFGLVLAAAALFISILLAVAGSASADQLLPIAFGDDGPRYAESHDMQNLALSVSSLRGYDLDQFSLGAIDEPVSDDQQAAAVQNQNPFGVLTGAVMLLFAFGAICAFRVLQSAGRFGWDISLLRGRWTKIPNHRS